MDFLYAVLGGISCKLYDDLNDNQMIGPRVQEILKGTQWILLTLLSHNDFNFATINLIANAGNALNNWGEWNHPYETSLLCLAPLFLLISASTAHWLTVSDIVCSSIWIVGMFLEPMFVTEEVSKRKFYLRLFGILLALVPAIGGMLYFDISHSIIKVCMYCVGYSTTSACFQAYMLWQKNESVSVEER
jgi:hypothetical protein